MKNKYDEMMEHIEVTPQMRERILQNIERADLTPQRTRKAVRSSYIRQLAALAACLVVILTLAIAQPGLLQSLKGNDSPGIVAPANGMVEADSLEELSAMVGFDVCEVSDLPFRAEEVTYISYWEKLAEITYRGEGKTATWRTGISTEDISGDFNAYESETALTANGITVTLKGSADVYTLATWTDGTYAYALSLSDGITAARWQTLLDKGF
ncbi:MAG: hypothetical protein HUJ80_00480 [Firmicutes bacterium]|nr:hypothetical protein [Bacillota bacterium]